MSPDLERLIGRATADEQFLNDLKANPRQTISNSGLNITEDEIKQIEKILRSMDSVSRDINKLTGSQKLDW